MKRGDGPARLFILYHVSSAEITHFNDIMGVSDPWGRDALKIPSSWSPELIKKEFDRQSADHVLESGNLSSRDFFSGTPQTNCVQLDLEHHSQVREAAKCSKTFFSSDTCLIAITAAKRCIHRSQYMMHDDECSPEIRSCIHCIRHLTWPKRKEEVFAMMSPTILHHYLR